MAAARLGDQGLALGSFEQADAWVKAHAPDHPALAHLRDQAAALLHG